jgi:hypothetical protein
MPASLGEPHDAVQQAFTTARPRSAGCRPRLPLGLDPIATRRIEELMQELKDEYTIELITHNMQQATRVADLTAFFGVDISHGGRTGYPVEMGKQPRYSKRRANS